MHWAICTVDCEGVLLRGYAWHMDQANACYVSGFSALTLGVPLCSMHLGSRYSRFLQQGRQGTGSNREVAENPPAIESMILYDPPSEPVTGWGMGTATCHSLVTRINIEGVNQTSLPSPNT